ncbi:MAG TPA: hypothetical protein VGF48_05835 [Thermoanaerobaculia bacterium]|jgi:hypothetical protein
MSRKFDRRQQIEKAAFEALKGSIRPKPWWMPLLIWRPVLAVCLKIAFR